MPIKIIKDKQGIEHYVLIDGKTAKEPKKDYWVRIPQKWWRKELKELTPLERCLLISLRIAGKFKPSTNYLAKELGIDWHTADKGLKSLRKKGFLH